MEVIIQPDGEQAAQLVARIIARALRGKPDLVLGLATGQTMVPVYAHLVHLHRTAELDFSRCRTFNLDEYIGLSPSDVNSFRHFMNTQLFDHVNIDKKKTYVPDGMATDLAAECDSYEAAIRRVGGIDLQLLGIGQSGHIGFNDPLSALTSRTRPTVLSPVTIAQNGAQFGDPQRMPRRALTMGVGTILESRRCILLALGSAKAGILAKAVEGPVTSMISASALQMHQNCVVITDRAAASQLQGAEHYRWVFNNEPEWAEFR